MNVSMLHMCGGGHAWQGACMAGVCVAGGHAWQGHAWRGTCVVGRGACMAGDTATTVAKLH